MSDNEDIELDLENPIARGPFGHILPSFGVSSA